MMLSLMGGWFLMEDLDGWTTLILRQLDESLVFQLGSPGTFSTQLLEMGIVEFLVVSEASRNRSCRQRLHGGNRPLRQAPS